MKGWVKWQQSLCYRKRRRQNLQTFCLLWHYVWHAFSFFSRLSFFSSRSLTVSAKYPAYFLIVTLFHVLISSLTHKCHFHHSLCRWYSGCTFVFKGSPREPLEMRSECLWYYSHGQKQSITCFLLLLELLGTKDVATEHKIWYNCYGFIFVRKTLCIQFRKPAFWGQMAFTSELLLLIVQASWGDTRTSWFQINVGSATGGRFPFNDYKNLTTRQIKICKETVFW